MSYLIRGGLLYDGTGAAGVKKDVRVKDGVIEEIGPSLASHGGTETEIDAAGRLVAPGLIDLHAHVFDGTGIWSIPAETCGLKKGVTTLLDTGSAGALTYKTFEKYVIPQAQEEIYALLNISMLGCLRGHRDFNPHMGELSDARNISAQAAIDCLEEHRSLLIGMKVRLTAVLADGKEENERLALQAALQAAEATRTPLMVHHAVSNIPTQELLESLRPGDIYTHLYHPHRDRAFEAYGRPFKVLLEAQQRGVVCDVGHGAGAFSWNVAEAACREHGFWPTTISTDVHAYNIDGPVWDMATTLSKFLYLGMPIEKIIESATSAPARAMGIEQRVGTLEPGKQADIVLLEIEEGEFPLFDVTQEVRTADKKFKVAGTMKKGAFDWVNA